MKCNKCYGEYDEGANYCPHCGEPLKNTQSVPEATAEQPPVYEAPQYDAPPNCSTVPVDAPSSGVLNTGLLVWSIINTAVCCQLLGIIALVLTILAKGESTAAGERKKLKTARILNLIGTIGGVLITLISIVLGVAVGVAETFYYSW